jgi:hypothetical protein
MARLSLTSALDTALARAAERTATLGVSARLLVLGGFVVGLLAIPAIALGRFWIGLALVVVSRAATLVGRPNASELAATLAALFLASLPFAFALADPSRALASCFALFGFVAFVSVRRVDALVEVICAALFAAACALPGWFSLIAYALGIACFAAVGATLARRLP